MFQYEKGQFYYVVGESKKLINLEDIGSKLLSKTNITDPMSFFPPLLNAMINGIVWLAKLLFEFFVSIHSALGSGSRSIDTVIKLTINKQTGLFQTLFSTFLPLAGVLLVGYAFYIQATKKVSAFRIILTGLLTMGFVRALYLPLNNNPESTGVLTLYSKVSGIVENIGNSVVGGLSSTGDQEVLSSYFENAIWIPYKGMNSDLTSGGKYNLTDDQLYSLLPFDNHDEKFKMVDGKGKETTIGAVAGTEDKVKVTHLRKLGKKAVYAFMMFLEVIVLGIVISAFSIFGLFLKASIILIFYGLPYIGILSLFPFFSNALFTAGRKLLSAMVLSNVMGAGSILFLMLNSTLQDTYMTIFNQDILLSYSFKALTYYLLWRFRHQIAEIFSLRRFAFANRVLDRLGNASGNALQTGLSVVKKPAIGSMLLANGALKTAGYYAGQKLSNLNQARRIVQQEKQRSNFMAQGDSFEVASLKTAQGVEEKKLKRLKTKQAFSNVVNGSKALYHDLMQKGYVNQKHPDRDEHVRKLHKANHQMKDKKIAILDQKRKVKGYDQAIAHQKGLEEMKTQAENGRPMVKKQALPPTNTPLYVDFTQSPKRSNSGETKFDFQKRENKQSVAGDRSSSKKTVPSQLLVKGKGSDVKAAPPKELQL